MNENKSEFNGRIIKIAGLLALALILSAVLYIGLSVVVPWDLGYPKADGPFDETTGYTTVAAGSEVIADVKHVQIQWVSGNVKVVGEKVSAVTFSEVFPESPVGIGAETEPMRYKTEDDGTLVIRDTSRSYSIGKSHNKTLLITLPNSLIESLYVNTASAATEVSALDAGTLGISTASGDVYVSGSMLRDTALNSVSGNCTVEGAVTTLNYSTASGNLDFTGTAGTGNISTVSGEVRLKFPSGPDVHKDMSSLDVNTTSGDVYVSGAVIQDAFFSTVSGDFMISGEVGNLIHSSTSGTLGFTGTAETADVSTLSADVTFKLPPDSDVYTEINTMSGKIEDDFKDNG